MGLVLILVGLFCIGVAIYYWLFVHEKGADKPLEIIERQQKKVDTEAGVFENYTKRRKVESQTKFQEAVNENKRAVTQAIVQESAVIKANLEKEVLPERHEQTLAKDTAETETFLALKKAEQQEFGLRKELAAVAAEKLLSVEDWSAVQKHHYMTQIDLKKRGDEIQQDLDGADRYELTQHELINKLTIQFNQLVKERRKIELEEKDEYVKGQLLARHDKNIKVVEQLIDGRQTRLLLSENGQENGSNPSTETEGDGYSEETPETD